MDPALSLCAAGRVGSGDRGGVNHSHTHSQVSWGDRTSGFNGLRTSGPPGLHQGRGTRRRPRQESPPLEDKLPPGDPSPTNVSLLFAKTSAGSALGL